jgi:hypothetical protein
MHQSSWSSVASAASRQRSASTLPGLQIVNTLRLACHCSGFMPVADARYEPAGFRRAGKLTPPDLRVYGSVTRTTRRRASPNICPARINDAKRTSRVLMFVLLQSSVLRIFTITGTHTPRPPTRVGGARQAAVSSAACCKRARRRATGSPQPPALSPIGQLPRDVCVSACFGGKLWQSLSKGAPIWPKT